MRKVVFSAVTAAMLVVGCGDLEDPPSGTTGTFDDEPAIEQEPAEEEEAPDSGEILVVFVFAENPAEESYYDVLRSSFEAETGIVVDLEVRLP